jgi:hypothetical protein
VLATDARRGSGKVDRQFRASAPNRLWWQI